MKTQWREEKINQVKEIDRDHKVFLILTFLSIVIMVLLMLVAPSVWDSIDNVHPVAVLFGAGAILIFVIRAVVVRKKMW